MRLKEILVTLLITLATLNTTQAQTPNSFPYQAAARSVNGWPLANKAITARISLRDSIASGTVVYRETHSLTTNALGLFDLRVGQGTVVSGSFSAINWGGAAKFLQTEIDTGSGNFLDMGTTQLLSVPYALYAQNSGNGVPSGGLDGQVLTRCNGQYIWTTGGLCPTTGAITALNCASTTNSGTLTSGTSASGVSSSILYTGGNGGTFSSQTVNSSGVTGLTATLTAGTLATGAGNLTYTITGTPGAAGTASFAISLGGQSCTLTRTVSLPAATLTALNCASATDVGPLTSGIAANGVISTILYTGGNGGTYNGQTVTSTGVTGLTATLAASTLATGAGSLIYTITGTPSAAGTASFSISLGGQSCTFTRTVSLPFGTLTALNCASVTTTGTLTSGTAASGVSSSIPYTGGNGGMYSSQTVNSTGVTGLTATLTAGTLATGAGSLTYTITGTPGAAGTASFAISLGGQNCTINIVVASSIPTYPAGTVHCGGTPTAIVEVTNPVTGRIWMDRNLGASRAATSSTDSLAYGDLYQWGRRADGHQCRNSATTTTLSSTDQPAHGNFILSPSAGTNTDWRSPRNDNLWQGVNGINNPCPSGYRLPTESELNAERTSWFDNKAEGAFRSPLKLPVAGRRRSDNGSLEMVGTNGRYWSSTINAGVTRGLDFSSSTTASTGSSSRANAGSVRCLKD